MYIFGATKTVKKMKKFLTFIAVLSTFTSLFAGGLVTNTNQSARFTRMLCRDATLGVDAVYYNPAGLNRLEDGFYLSLSNQSIFQEYTIGNNYNFLTDPTFNYIGTVEAPLFPSVYAAYKTGKLAFSFGFNPIGGGGGAVYTDGLPSFEMMVADLVPMLVGQLTPLDMGVQAVLGTDFGFRNVTGYAADIFFEGSSIYFGYQGNVSYEISDKLSMSIGARLVTAKNTYQGYVNNVTVNAPTAYGGVQTPGTYLRFIAGALTPYVGPEDSNVLSLLGTADALDVQTNLEADVTREGSGITPIVSLNYALSDKVNLAVKYEFKTELELKTTVIDGKGAGGMFVQDATTVADMPAMLQVGATLRPTDKLLISTGLHYYFDKNNDYDGSLDMEVEMIDNNSFEYALGLEYGLSDKISVSGGWLMTKTGVNDLYQSDQRFSLNTNTFGGGFGINILPILDLDLGASYTIYEEGSRGFPYALGTQSIAVTETYNKSAMVFSVGLSFSFVD